jgi:ElaB/YqjD/DUF883 family membrane-anchored ribosome-binding protein
MGQDPDAIRREIEQTRNEMGDTIDALGHKADVKSRAKENVQEKKAAVVDKVQGVMGRANEATPSTGEVKQAGRKAVSTAQENPLGLAVGAAAVGFMAGMLMPSTRVENEKIGETADQMKSQIKDTASEAVERGKQVAQDAAQSAQETVKESGQQQAQELAASASPQS